MKNIERVLLPELTVKRYYVLVRCIPRRSSDLKLTS